MSQGLTVFDRDTLVLLSFMELGRTGEFGVTVTRSKKGFTVRIGRYLRVSGKTLAECQAAVPAAINRISERHK